MSPRPRALALFLALLVTSCGRGNNPPASPSNAGAIDRLNKLIRGELSAVETYQQAIEKQGAAVGELATLRMDHEDAATQLKGRVQALDGTPSTESKAWGDFTKAVEGVAKVFGNNAAISALKTGERHGVSEYEDALADGALDAVSKDLIRVTLLPRQRGHEAQLESAKTQ